MNSLRSRLVLGFALVAIVPLAVTMVLLSKRIDETMRAQAAERLETTLAVLQRQWRIDGERTLDKLAILARDPVLKRLYLVQAEGGRDLSDYLAEKRVLLGLDFLAVVDTGGSVAGEASAAASAAIPGGGDALRPTAGGNPVRQDVTVVRLEGVAALAMTARAPILYQNEPVGMVRGGVVLDADFLTRLKQTSGVDLVLRDASGRIVAATLGPDVLASLPPDGAPMGTRAYLLRRFPLEAGREPAGGAASPSPGRASLTGIVSTAAAERTIAALRTTSAFMALWGVAIAAALGVLWSLQISRPVERLALFSQRIARGDWDEPLALRSVRELETLVTALDRMRRDLRAYREKLVASERHAAWSLMARKVAHEVKNPLTPIAVSVADLKRSYDLKRADFPEILDQAVRTVGEEVQALKRLLQEFSDFGRFPEPQFAACRLPDLLADLETLYARETAAGRLTFRRGEDLVLSCDRAHLRQALVNLIKNGLEAVEGGGHVDVAARAQDHTLEITVSDTGPGLTREQQERLFVPDFTTKAHGSGLGLTIVERIVNDHRGTITVESETGRGTIFRIRLPTDPAQDRERGAPDGALPS